MAVRDVYRTNDGRHYYEFAFVDKGSHFEANILNQPDYGSRDTGLHSTHRLESDHPGCSYRICFGDDSNVPTLNKVRTYAETWCEATSKYIDNGTRF